MNPIVAMNSSTGIPLSTWTFLKTSSAISGFVSDAGWPPRAAWPFAGVTEPLSRQTIAVPNKPTVVRHDPTFTAAPFLSLVCASRESELARRQPTLTAEYWMPLLHRNFFAQQRHHSTPVSLVGD